MQKFAANKKLLVLTNKLPELYIYYTGLQKNVEFVIEKLGVISKVVFPPRIQIRPQNCSSTSGF